MPTPILKPDDALVQKDRLEDARPHPRNIWEWGFFIGLSGRPIAFSGKMPILNDLLSAY